MAERYKLHAAMWMMDDSDLLLMCGSMWSHNHSLQEDPTSRLNITMPVEQTNNYFK